MAEIILKIIKWSAVVAFFAGSVLSFVSLLIYMIGLLTTALNASIIGDILALVQMWLPFNLMVLIGWTMTATALYLTYKISLFVFNHAVRFLNV